MVFVNANEPNVADVVKYAYERIFITQSLYFAVGVMEVLTGYLRALGRSITPMITSVFSICVIRVVWAFLIFPIPALYSLTGLYLIYPISWFLCSTLQFITILVVNKKIFTKKNEVAKEEQNEAVA
jgi:Na+-driven multidrug efflux pump